MNLFAQLALFLWIPIVAAIFTALPPKRAVITSYIVAWLALPGIGFSVKGLPDYTKMSATAAGILLCLGLFDQARIFSFRPRWYDLPMGIWCTSPFCTSLVNDLGAYDGISACLDPIISWGIPYFIGRIYLTDLESIRQLALGMVVGALVYVPLCLIEIRLVFPIFPSIVYGINNYEPLRYGSYRPRIFMDSGLQLGLWMVNATLICQQLWTSKSVRQIKGVSIVTLLLGLFVTTVLCRSTGALVELVAGVIIISSCKFFKKSWPIWLLILFPPVYTTVRTFNLWSGQEAIEATNAVFGEGRAESIAFRIKMEDLLAGRARESLIFGWGRFDRSATFEKSGKKATTPDGYWIITLGISGMVGLSALEMIMLLPVILTVRRFPVSSWKDPQVAPVMALSMVLLLSMIDYLSNAMLNPIYALAMGGVIGQSAIRASGRRREGEDSLAVASGLVSEGRAVEAGLEFRRAADLSSKYDDEESRCTQAQALDGLGHFLMATGRHSEAEPAFREALIIRDWLVAQSPDAGRFRDLAIAREGLSRVLAEIGRSAEAIDERRIALQIWDILVADHPKDLDYRNHRVDALNDLAWLLSTDADPTLRDLAWALHMAEQAASSMPDHPACWNTLGVTRYRSGDWPGAIEALERSAFLSLDGRGTAFDHYFMAMAWCRLQHQDHAREWLEQGIAWASQFRPGQPALERFRKEAESLLMSGIEDGSEGSFL